jgi:hypothetical protein
MVNATVLVFEVSAVKLARTLPALREVSKLLTVTVTEEEGRADVRIF